jgi:hypothetical protein
MKITLEEENVCGLDTCGVCRITMLEQELIVGEKGDKGDKGDPGGALTAGPGTVIVGTEIRLSIGTLPQAG